jgi:chromosome segregation ATPase
MEPFGIGMAGLGVAGLASAGAFGLAFRQRRRRLARRPRSTADRLEALAAAQAELGLRLDAISHAPEEKLQAMAGQLLGLIRDKNATFETALAGLDQLRARMRALEQMGEPAEARALVERLGARLDELQAEGAARAAALEARLGALEGPGIAERLAQLHAAKDAGIAAVLGRLGPLEARLGGIEGELGGLGPAREGLQRLEARIEALAAEQGAARAELAALQAGPAPAQVLEGLAKLHAQQDTLAAVLARLAALEDPHDRIAERLEAVQGRLAALEGAGNPFAEVSEQLTRLYGQKDAAVEAVLARLVSLEARLATLDPQAALDRFAERLEAVQGRLAALEGAENPFAEISEQLTRLYGQKDAAVEAVFMRLQPLEAKLAAIENGLAERDPRALLDRFAERLEAVQGRIAALEGAGDPFAEISEQLTRLYGQKDAAVETVLGRLAPLEAKLAALDPQAALDRFAGRLEVVQGRLAALEDAGNPFAEISEQLTRLYGQKDAAVETVLGRLAPLEAKLAALAAGQGEPRALLDRFAERLEAVQGRVAALEGAGNPFAEISEQLTRLYGQKDAAVETVFMRLQPLEAKLAEIEGGLARLAPDAVEGLRARVEALHRAQGEVAAGLAALQGSGEQLARLLDDTALEARLAALEARDGAARAERPEAGARPDSAPRAPTAEEIEAIWSLPRIVSVHR